LNAMTRTALEAGTAQALVVRSIGNHHEPLRN